MGLQSQTDSLLETTYILIMNLLASLVFMALCLVGVPAPVAFSPLQLTVDSLVDAHCGEVRDVLKVGRMLGTFHRRDDAIATLVEGPGGVRQDRRRGGGKR